MARCIVCDGFVPPVKTFEFPGFYCVRCYAQWGEHEHEPWLHELLKSEVRLRVQNHRLRKQNVLLPEIPLNHLGQAMVSRNFMGWTCAACLSAASPPWVRGWVCWCGNTKRVREYETERRC